jgi:membrane protease YdiL (CAAX protease family)
MTRQPTWQRVIVLTVLGYEAAGGLSGGALLAAAPDGRLMDMPVDMMHGFFRDFFVPGLILVAMGILNAAAFAAVWRRTRTDWLLAGLALGGFTVWFMVEIAVLQSVHWLHAMWGLPVLVGGVMALPLIPSRSGAEPFVKQHPVLTFYALAFAISWGAMLLVIFVNGLPRTQDAFARQVTWMIPAMLAGPSIAGVLTAGFASGKAGLGELFSGVVRWRVGAGWYAVALLTAPAVFLVVHALLSLASPVYAPLLVTTVGDKLPFLLVGVLSALGVGFCEELGWTGVAIPRLRLRHGVLGTALIVGVLWGAWHVAFIRLWPGLVFTGDLPLGLFLGATSFFVLVGGLPAYRVLMVWVYDRTGSLLVAMLMHASLTAATFVLGATGPMAGLSFLAYDAAMGATWWAVVAVVLLANHGRLTRQPLAIHRAEARSARAAA